MNIGTGEVRTQVDGEGAPLRAARVEVVVFDVQVARADGLRAQTIEERHLRSGRDAHCTKERQQRSVSDTIILRINLR